MKLALGSDEKTILTDHLQKKLTELGHELILIGAVAGGDLTWPHVGHAVGETVASGKAEQGIVLCWTGTGVSIAANKVAGIRAALCSDAVQADGARKWNDANVLVLSIRLTTTVLADEILNAWFSAPGLREWDQKCVAAVKTFEK